jgi:prepilin-type N-terminal cleavage/methylation domain-containing protein
MAIFTMISTRHNKILYDAPNDGFTLIEVVMYLALFAILFGGAVLAAYNVIEGSGKNQTRAQLQEEGDFLAGKLAWVLSGAQTVTTPITGSQASILSLTKYGGTTWTVNANGANMELQTASGTFPLNSSAIQLAPGTLRFTHTASSGGGTNPESVTTAFTLTAKSPGGADMRQDFTTTTYLRK